MYFYVFVCTFGNVGHICIIGIACDVGLHYRIGLATCLFLNPQISHLYMQNLLAQIDPNLLSVTGVIATILAVIFGLGAFYNSRTRKKHLLELEKAQRQEQAMHFRPAKSHVPGRSVHPGRSRGPTHPSSSSSAPAKASTPRAAPVAKSTTPPESTPKKSSTGKQVLFRKVRPDGVDSKLESPNEDQELYVWE